MGERGCLRFGLARANLSSSCRQSSSWAKTTIKLDSLNHNFQTWMVLQDVTFSLTARLVNLKRSQEKAEII